MLTVRDARPDEARAIAEVHVVSWRAAYRGLLPAEVLDGISVDGRERMWAGILRDPAPRRAVLVAAEEAKVLGFAALGPSRVAELAVEAGTTEGIAEGTVEATTAETGIEIETGEVYALYLHPDHWGTGLGARLHTAGLRRLREYGFASAVLWVLAGNERALAFYRRAGWTEDGGTKLDHGPGGAELDEIRLTRTLPPD
jgi:ribosomal protein S18 acetylase RimI-like enzyme